MPEMPEVQAHAERLTADFAGRALRALRAAHVHGAQDRGPGARRGLRAAARGRRPARQVPPRPFEPVTFVVHLMQGGRLLVDAKQSAKPRGGQARFVFDGRARRCCSPSRAPSAGPACGASTERRRSTSPPLDSARPRGGPRSSRTSWLRPFKREAMRLHGFLRDQHASPGSAGGWPTRSATGQALAVRDDRQARPRRRRRPSSRAIRECVDEGLAYERTRDDMSSSKDRPAHVHGRTGEPCPVCGDTSAPSSTPATP